MKERRKGKGEEKERYLMYHLKWDPSVQKFVISFASIHLSDKIKGLPET